MSDSATVSDGVTVLTSVDLQAIEWVPLHGDGRIANKVLWKSESGDMIVGLMRLQPGAENAGHMQPAAAQHAWIIEGHARVAGHEVSSGSYAFVPPGADHHTVTIGSQPCTIFYVYQPFAPGHAQHAEG